MSFPQRLKHERLVKGWTIEQLSQASGVTVQRISMLERNLVEIVSDGLKAALEKALEISFDAPPTEAPSGTVEVVAAAVAAPVVVPAPAVPAVPEPLALHLSVALHQQLEAAAAAHGRSLHGEILARLEASLREADAAAAAAVPAMQVQTSQAASRDTSGVIQLSEANLAHITAQVALRLKVQPEK